MIEQVSLLAVKVSPAWNGPASTHGPGSAINLLVAARIGRAKSLVFDIIHSLANRQMRFPLRAFSIFLFVVMSCGPADHARPPAAGSEASSPRAIVIGFLGGYVRHDNRIHAGVQIADRLRKDFPSGVDIEVFENHRGEQAHQEILELLDTDHNGSLSSEEKKNARIIIYGHSWGASETVMLARALERDGIPVLLTIQVDSVPKHGIDDSEIPANVEQAINFYQANGVIHGLREIHAADPSRTQIIGNFQLDYDAHPVQCAGYPWFARLFERPHIEIECDPNVQDRVESLIRSKLPSPVEHASAK